MGEALSSATDALARLAVTEVCPGCGASLTWKPSPDGQGVDLLHPQPPCAAFKRFVDDLLERHAQQRAERDQQRATKLWGWCAVTGIAKVDCFCEACKAELQPVEPS